MFTPRTHACQRKDNLVVTTAEHTSPPIGDSGKVVEFHGAENQSRLGGAAPPKAAAVGGVRPVLRRLPLQQSLFAAWKRFVGLL